MSENEEGENWEKGKRTKRAVIKSHEPRTLCSCRVVLSFSWLYSPPSCHHHELSTVELRNCSPLVLRHFHHIPPPSIPQHTYLPPFRKKMQHLPHRKEDEVVATTKLRRRTAHGDKKPHRRARFFRSLKSCFTMCWGSSGSSQAAKDKQEAWERRKLMDDYDSEIDYSDEEDDGEDERLIGPEGRQTREAPRSFLGGRGQGKRCVSWRN